MSSRPGPTGVVRGSTEGGLGMYGQIGGVSAAAGVPAALVFTGVTGSGFALLLGATSVVLVVGITVLRRLHRGR
jgi:hypothetical protein